MDIIIMCEYSGALRESFRKRGHNVWSCDILDAEDGSMFHYKQDIIELLKMGFHFDAGFAFPPCTDLCVSGARWFAQKQADGRQQKSIEFFMELVHAIKKIGKGAVENPKGIMSTHYRKPDQIIQPWQFGHGEVKGTCLWLENLPKLIPTNIVNGREARIHEMGPVKNRGLERSRTYQGIADAMAAQWG